MLWLGVGIPPQDRVCLQPNWSFMQISRLQQAWSLLSPMYKKLKRIRPMLDHLYHTENCQELWQSASKMQWITLHAYQPSPLGNRSPPLPLPMNMGPSKSRLRRVRVTLSCTGALRKELWNALRLGAAPECPTARASSFPIASAHPGTQTQARLQSCHFGGLHNTFCRWRYLHRRRIARPGIPRLSHQ